MAFDADKMELNEGSDIDIRRDWPSRFWRPRRVNVGPVSAEQKFAIVALGLANAVNLGDHDALVASIEGLSGIQKAVITVYGQTPPESKIPAGYDLLLGVEAAYQFKSQQSIFPSPSPSPSP